MWDTHHDAASSTAVANNVTYSFHVHNPDADPLAMDWVLSCGNLGRNGFFADPTGLSSPTSGPVPVQVIYHHTASNPKTINSVHVDFGAARDDNHAPIMITRSSPDVHVIRGTLARLLLQHLR